MTNTSATGGYLQPVNQNPFPNGLNFRKFLQTVFVGISGLSPGLVRPSWQKNTPKQPDIDTNWLAIALKQNKADANAFSGPNSNGENITQRMEDLEIGCTFYGPDSMDVASLTRDGFQIPQNLEALTTAHMGFVSATDALHVPDLVNERWVDRYEMSVFLRREVLRSYPILTFLKVGMIDLEVIVDGDLKTFTVDANSARG